MCLVPGERLSWTLTPTGVGYSPVGDWLVSFVPASPAGILGGHTQPLEEAKRRGKNEGAEKGGEGGVTYPSLALPSWTQWSGTLAPEIGTTDGLKGEMVNSS